MNFSSTSDMNYHCIGLADFKRSLKCWSWVRSRRYVGRSTGSVMVYSVVDKLIWVLIRWWPCLLGVNLTRTFLHHRMPIVTVTSMKSVSGLLATQLILSLVPAWCPLAFFSTLHSFYHPQRLSTILSVVLSYPLPFFEAFRKNLFCTASSY